MNYAFTHEQAFRPSAMRRCNACPGSYALHRIHGDALTTQTQMATHGNELHNYLYDMVRTRNTHLANKSFSDYEYKNTSHTAKKLLAFHPEVPWQIEVNMPVMVGARQVAESHVDLMKVVKDDMNVTIVYIVDYKSMCGEHETSNDSCQLRSYALAAFDAFPDASKICVAIEEPAVKRTRSLKFFEYLPEARHKLTRWLSRIDARCQAALTSVNETGLPSLEHFTISTECKFCPVSSICPLVEENRKLSEELGGRIEGEPQEYGRIYDTAVAIISAQTQIKNAILEKVMADFVCRSEIVEGFNIKDRPLRTTVESTEGIVKQVQQYLPLDIILSFCTIELGKLKKEFIAQVVEADGVSKVDAEKLFDTLVYPYTNKPDSKYQYASRSK